MKLFLLLPLFGLTKFVKSQDVPFYAGVQSIFAYNRPYVGVICKATHENLQGAFYYNSSAQFNDFDMGFQLGYNFYNKHGMLVGTNMAFGRYIYFPSLNVLYSLNSTLVLDFNLRPSRSLFSTEISILYRFK